MRLGAVGVAACALLGGSAVAARSDGPAGRGSFALRRGLALWLCATLGVIADARVAVVEVDADDAGLTGGAAACVLRLIGGTAAAGLAVMAVSGLVVAAADGRAAGVLR